MIHIIIGGSLSGKSTFVKNKFIESKTLIEETRIYGVPVSLCDPGTVVIGHYNKSTRNVGVDQMGRDYRLVHKKLYNLLDKIQEARIIAMEGNALADCDFLSHMCPSMTKIYLIKPDPKEVSLRYKKLGLNYGRSIVSLSYRRALKAWNEYKGIFHSELVDQSS